MSQSSIKINDRVTIEIERLIFHVIIKGAIKPQYLREITLNENEKDFFKERISDACDGTQYIFVGEEDGSPKIVERVSNKIIRKNNDFVTGSKELAMAFLNKHKGSASDGVFLISLFNIEKDGIPVKLLALIKIDHTRVITFDTKGERAILKEIRNTFVEDKKALQKTAIINISEKYGWDVTANERHRADDVADYFKEFLGVQVRTTAYVLTQKANKAVKDWFKSIDVSLFPPGESLSSYRSRVQQYCNTHTTFKTKEFVNMVVYDDDKARKSKLAKALLAKLEEVGVAGQEFKPDVNALNKAKRSVAKSSNNVKILWEGNAKSRGIDFGNNLPDDNGQYSVIVISDAPFIQD